MKTALLAARLVRRTTRVLGLALILSSLAAPARADIFPTPEIDAGSMTTALTLLVGGALTLTGRTRRDG